MNFFANIGLNNFAMIPSFDIDFAMITALVMRWRPKTNTFHLNFNEAMVSLEDVAYIYDLFIDGEGVSG